MQPPELIERGTLSPATDVYSFGVLIFEMWVGQRAWKGLRAAAILSNVIGGQGLQPPRDAPPELQVSLPLHVPLTFAFACVLCLSLCQASCQLPPSASSGVGAVTGRYPPSTLVSCPAAGVPCTSYWCMLIKGWDVSASSGSKLTSLHGLHSLMCRSSWAAACCTTQLVGQPLRKYGRSWRNSVQC